LRKREVISRAAVRILIHGNEIDVNGAVGLAYVVSSFQKTEVHRACACEDEVSRVVAPRVGYCSIKDGISVKLDRQVALRATGIVGGVSALRSIERCPCVNVGRQGNILRYNRLAVGVSLETSKIRASIGKL